MESRPYQFARLILKVLPQLLSTRVHLEFFRGQKKERNLRYSSLFSDGDSKSFEESKMYTEMLKQLFKNLSVLVMCRKGQALISCHKEREVVRG